ncbi:MAG: trigger factor [Pseudanabaenaceae cyanobacterium SKYGB_i_bin29]|nr:trigger factor [Pseudanabaenaceae cyanobacterium SKYG29]MDW8422357.1 trigger factor [Pseudanabaenaceae cyanobacterium SKYGB_i_bin29]
MKITSELLPGSQIRFHIEIDGEQSRRIYDRVLTDLMRKVRVPGFRPGKAPRQIVINQVGTESLKASVFDELLQDALKQVFSQAQEKGKSLIGRPQIEPEGEQLLNSLQIGSQFSFSLTLDYEPEVQLGDYKNLQVTAGKVKPDPEYVDKILKQYRRRHATLVPVDDRPVQAEDVVTLDSVIIDPESNEVIETMAGEAAQIALEENVLQYELFRMLLGMNVGAEKEQEMTLPEDFPLEHLREKRVRVKHKIVDIKYRDLPPLDDEFARTISNKQTLAELQEYLQQQAIEEAAAATDANITEALLAALEAITTVDLPQSMVQAEVDKLTKQRARHILTMVGTDPDQAEQLLADEDLTKKLRDLVTPEAISSLKQSFALLKIAELENLTPKPEAVEEQLREYKEALRGRNYDKDTLAEFVAESLKKDLALDWLKHHATIELVDELESSDPDQEEHPTPEAADLGHNTDS